MRYILHGPLGVLFLFAGPITYIIGVIDTWQGNASVLVKILIALSIDAFLAMIWPVTWTLWMIMYFLGKDSPISTVLGL